jgi:hypothetical protein
MIANIHAYCDDGHEAELMTGVEPVEKNKIRLACLKCGHSFLLVTEGEIVVHPNADMN